MAKTISNMSMNKAIIYEESKVPPMRSAHEGR